MPDWPFLNQRELVTIHPWSPESLGPQLNAWNQGISGVSSLTTSGRTFSFPFALAQPVLVSRLWVHNGASPGGNFDIGIYDPSGIRISSAGSTVQSGASVIQSCDIPDFFLPSGSYYLALAAQSGVPTVLGRSLGTALARYVGIATVTVGSFPLPARVTFDITSPGANCYLYGLTGKALI